MALPKFYDLWDWREGRNLALDIYSITSKFPVEEKYNLTSQLRSASVSIPANIAEGTGRGTKKDVNRFLKNARGSAQEMISHLDISHALKYLGDEKYEELFVRYNKLSVAINNHISAIERSDPNP